MSTRRWFALIMVVVASVVGIASLAYPYTLGATTGGIDAAHATDAPLALIAIVLVSLATIMAALDSGDLDARRIGALVTLVIVDALVLVLPGPLGPAAGLVLPILYGYTNGSVAGFLLGILASLLSALLRGNVTYMLPTNMLMIGWSGACAGCLRIVARWPRTQTIVLSAWALVWGLLSGAIAVVWSWPYLAGGGWEAGMSAVAAVKSLLALYVETTLPEALAVGLLAAALEALAAFLLLPVFRRALDNEYTVVPSRE